MASRLHRLPLLLLPLLCLGAAPGRGLEVAGEAAYQDLPYSTEGVDLAGAVERPIRFAQVDLVDTSGRVWDTTESDAQGRFSLTLPREAVDDPDLPEVHIRVHAHSEGRGREVRVAQPGGAVYALVSDILTDPTETVRLLARAEGHTGPPRPPKKDEEGNALEAEPTPDEPAVAPTGAMRLGPIFNILDQFHLMADFWQAGHPDQQFPPLMYVYQPGANLGTGYAPAKYPGLGRMATVELIGDLVDGGDGIDDDGYDDCVIQHETGHYLDGMIASTSELYGTHRGTWSVDPGLSLSEGLATFMGQMVLQTPHYIDTFGTDSLHDDLETVLEGDSRSARNIYGEDAVSATLWDLFDAPENDDDPFALPASAWWDVFAYGIQEGDWKSLHRYLDLLVERGHVTDEQLNEAFGAPPHRIARPPAPAHRFPLQTITESTTIEGSVDGAQGYDGRGIRFIDAMAHYGIELVEGQQATIRLVTTSGAASDDLDLLVESAQRRPRLRSDAGTGDEQVVLGVPGRSMIVVWAYSSSTSKTIPFRLEVTIEDLPG